MFEKCLYVNNLIEKTYTGRSPLILTAMVSMDLPPLRMRWPFQTI